MKMYICTLWRSSCTSPFPSAPANAYQYVPYASISSYAHLLNGDLIDLNDDANEGSKELTLEEVGFFFFNLFTFFKFFKIKNV